MSILVSFSDQINNLTVKLGIDQSLLGMGILPMDIAQGFVSLISGIVFGMLTKRYFKMLFWITCCTAGIIFFLEHKAILNINWSALNQFLGLAETTNFDNMLNLFFEWLKLNVFISVASIIGFLIGLKI
jgi:uncharacterized membrane protein (Fun14 family)